MTKRDPDELNTVHGADAHMAEALDVLGRQGTVADLDDIADLPQIDRVMARLSNVDALVAQQFRNLRKRKLQPAGPAAADADADTYTDGGDTHGEP